MNCVSLRQLFLCNYYYLNSLLLLIYFFSRFFPMFPNIVSMWMIFHFKVSALLFLKRYHLIHLLLGKPKLYILGKP